MLLMILGPEHYVCLRHFNCIFVLYAVRVVQHFLISHQYEKQMKFLICFT